MWKKCGGSSSGGPRAHGGRPVSTAEGPARTGAGGAPGVCLSRPPPDAWRRHRAPPAPTPPAWPHFAGLVGCGGGAGPGRAQAGPGGQGPGRGRRPERTPASPPLVALPAEKPSPLRGPRPLTRMGTRTPGPWDVTVREQARRGFTSHALPGRGCFGSDGATRMLAEAAFRVAGRTECCAIMCRFEDSEKCQAGASRNGPARLTVHERGSNLGLGWPDRGP